jgi:hypothetical protein
MHHQRDAAGSLLVGGCIESAGEHDRRHATADLERQVGADLFAGRTRLLWVEFAPPRLSIRSSSRPTIANDEVSAGFAIDHVPEYASLLGADRPAAFNEQFSPPQLRKLARRRHQHRTDVATTTEAERHLDEQSQHSCTVEEVALDAGTAKPVRNAAGYLVKNTKWLRYDRALADGLPIATGVIEGAYRSRHRITRQRESPRLRRSCTRWSPLCVGDRRLSQRVRC